MKIVVKKTGGGEDPPELTPQQRKEWNAYVNWLEKKGFKGSPLLDKRETGLATSLFNDFKKENPGVTLEMKHISSVQNEMQRLAQAARDYEARRGNPNAANVMQGTSKVDNWPGSKTTSFKFPDMEVSQTTDGRLTMHKNLGLLNSKLKPTDTVGLVQGQPNQMQLANGLKLEKMADGYYYQNRDGDWVKYNQ